MIVKLIVEERQVLHSRNVSDVRAISLMVLKSSQRPIILLFPIEQTLI